MASNRVIAGAMMVAGGLLGSGFFAGEARAQYESVGKPLQLVPQAYSSASAATPRARVAAKKAAKSEPKPLTRAVARSETRSEPKSLHAEAKAETPQHMSFRRKHAPRIETAEQKRPRHAVASAEAPAVRAAVAAAAVPAPQPAPAQTPAPANANQLVVGGQAVQVRSAEEANELDLAANTISPPPSPPATVPAPPPAAASTNGALYNLVATTPAAASEALPPAPVAPTPLAAVPAPVSPPTPAPVAPVLAAAAPTGHAATVAEADAVQAFSAQQAKSPIGSASWIMQIMAALGGAAAAGFAAWFLIGSATPRIKLSDWEEADGEA
jgi:hypothetical protein